MNEVGIQRDTVKIPDGIRYLRPKSVFCLFFFSGEEEVVGIQRDTVMIPVKGSEFKTEVRALLIQ